MFIIYRQDATDGDLTVMAVLETSRDEAEKEVEQYAEWGRQANIKPDTWREPRLFLLDTRTKVLTSFFTIQERLEAAAKA